MNTKKTMGTGLCAALVAGTVLAAGPAVSPMKTKPVWDLAKDAGERSAQFVRDGYWPLDWAHAFDIPNDALRDTSSFTVEISYTCDDLTTMRYAKFFSQKTPTTGWYFDMSINPRCGSGIYLGMNDGRFEAGRWMPQQGVTNTFVITARRGLVVVYDNGRLLKRFMMQIVPNLEPVHVGPLAADDGKGGLREIKGVRIRSLRLWDGSEEYWAPGETKEFAEGFRGGPGWLVSCPTEDPAKPLPRILCFGDSILGGYSSHIRRQLAGRAYVYWWRHFEGSPQGAKLNLKPYTAAASVAKFDAIVFNNGLHSPNWTEDKVTDAQVKETQRAICRGLRAGSPEAKMFWLSTTPQTAPKNAKGVVDSVGDLDPVVRRINRLTAEMAAEEKIGVIDGYGVLLPHLDWAIGDRYHWGSRAYDALAAAIVEKVMPAIPAK